LPADADELKERLLETPRIPMLWDSSHTTRRIAAQRSRFMVFRSEPTWLLKLNEKKKADSRIQALCLDPSAIPKIRNELKDAGVTESVISPDLDGLGRELNQAWESQT
jgi:hypothetical protein